MKRYHGDVIYIVAKVLEIAAHGLRPVVDDLLWHSQSGKDTP